jgi:hypothetical protein
MGRRVHCKDFILGNADSRLCHINLREAVSLSIIHMKLSGIANFYKGGGTGKINNWGCC